MRDMFLFLKNLKRATDDGDKVAPVPATPGIRTPEEFIPYYCHFNAHTLLTKNGELMQTIRIASNAHGLDYESGADAGSTVRETIRTAIRDAIHADKLSIWVHTLRKRREIVHDGTYGEPFAEYVHKQWDGERLWKFQYHNEIYVTLLHDGQSAELFDRRAIRQIFLPRRNRNYRNAYLDAACAQLDEVSAAMLEKIRKNYDARLLAVTERIPDESELQMSQPIFYSEPLEFLDTLINLRDIPCPLPDTDLSEALAPKSLTFGFNALELRDEANKKRFGAVLTLKEYREIPPDTSDRILQAPMEFVISQAFRFIPHNEALSQYKGQKELFDFSGDDYSMRASGIKEMLSANRKRPTDFGEIQTSIMVLADEYKQLDVESAKVQAAFAELGLVTVREDIRLEDAFWTQLPGNFAFIRRRDAISTTRLAGFARLNRFPCGNEGGNHWGEAVSLVPTLVNSPYFFNFHYQDNGHTALMDFNSFNDHAAQSTLNFLLTEARKYGGRLTIFDHGRSAQLLMEKLGGDYHMLPSWNAHAQAEPMRLNPFTLEPTPRNLSFLLAWCSSLATGVAITDAHKATLRTALQTLYAGPAEQRHLAGLTQLIATENPTLAKAFAIWQGHGKYGGLLDGTTETLDIAQALHGFDMTPVTTHPESVIPVFSYLLHRFIAAIDGKPSIIVLHDAVTLLENAFFAPRLESLMEMLQQNNVMVIFTLRNPAGCRETHTFRTLMENCATRLYVPDDVPVDYVGQDVGLTEGDAQLLRRMDRQKGDVLVRQLQDSVALRIDLHALEDIYAIMANDVKNLASAGGPFAAPAAPKI